MEQIVDEVFNSEIDDWVTIEHEKIGVSKINGDFLVDWIVVLEILDFDMAKGMVVVENVFVKDQTKAVKLETAVMVTV